MGPMIGLISTGMGSPSAAYEAARRLVKTAVNLERLTKETKGAAIESLSSRGNFGSWLLKLHKGHNVSVHLHFFVRLVEIVEELAAKSGKEVEHIQNVLAGLKGMEDAATDRASGDRSENFMREQSENSGGKD